MNNLHKDEKETQPSWRDHFSEDERRFIASSRQFAEGDLASSLVHPLCFIVTKMATLLDASDPEATNENHTIQT